MSKSLRWLLSIIAVVGGLFLIIMSFGEGVIGGTAGFWIQIVVGAVLIIAALALRPK